MGSCGRSVGAAWPTGCSYSICALTAARACYVTEPRNRFMRLFQKGQLFANAYMVAATKETIPATVVRPRLGRRATLVRGLVNPTTRNVA